MKYFFSVKPGKVAEEVAKEAARFVEVMSDSSQADVIAAIGGDGSLIHAISRYHQFAKPFVGINGGSEGYHCLIRRTKLEEGFARVDQVTPIQMAFLEVQFDGKVELGSQDIRIERRTGKAIRTSIKVDGKIVSRRHTGDGVLVSNSFGSTGYNRAAGGPVLPLESTELLLTPICPTYAEVAFDNLMNALVLTSPTIVLVPESDVCLVADNRDFFIQSGTKVTIRQSDRSFQFYPRR